MLKRLDWRKETLCAYFMEYLDSYADSVTLSVPH